MFLHGHLLISDHQPTFVEAKSFPNCYLALILGSQNTPTYLLAGKDSSIYYVSVTLYCCYFLRLMGRTTLEGYWNVLVGLCS